MQPGELIGSRTKGFFLKGGGYSLGGSSSRTTDTSSLEQYLSLPTQLAFNRKEIPGTSYKDIVDQALEKAVPGSKAQTALLKEESQAISRIQDEAETALKEGRKLRQLQAEATAAGTPGKTAGDAYGIYNFWINEANQAAQDGDMEYATIALRNAGNSRDLAEKRSQVEANKGEAAGKKELNKQLAAEYNNWQKDDNAYKSGLREIDDSYKKGLVSGRDADYLKSVIYAKQGMDLSERKKFLGELAANDINSMGGKDVQTLSESYDKTLNGNFNDSGKQTSPGIINQSDTLFQRSKDSNNYVDVVQPKMDQGYPTGEFEVVRKDRGFINSVDNSTGVYVRDDFGRYIELKAEDTANGKVKYTGYTIDPNGGVVSISTNEVDPTKQQGAAGLQLFVGDSKNPVSDYSAFGGGQAKDQYNIFGKQNDDTFLQDNYHLAPEQIAQARQLKYQQDAALAKQDKRSVLDRINPLNASNYVEGAKKFYNRTVAQPNYFNTGSDKVNQLSNIPKPTQEAFNTAIQKPQIELPKPLAAAPAPAFTAGTGQTTPNLTLKPVTNPTIKVPAAQPIHLASAPAVNPISTGINLGNMSISGAPDANKVESWLRATGDVYVDANEYKKVLNQTLAAVGGNQQQAQSLLDKAFTQGKYQKYKWLQDE